MTSPHRPHELDDAEIKALAVQFWDERCPAIRRTGEDETLYLEMTKDFLKCLTDMGKRVENKI